MTDPRKIIREARAIAREYCWDVDVIELCDIATEALDELDAIKAQAEDATEYVLASMLRDERAKSERLAAACRVLRDIALEGWLALPKSGRGRPTRGYERR